MKKKIFIAVFIIFIIVITIFAFTYIKKVIIIDKIKSKVANNLEYYYLNRELIKGNAINDQYITEIWKYKNGINVIENDSKVEILYKDEYYILDMNSKKYKKYIVDNSDIDNTFKIIEDFQYIPQDGNNTNNLEDSSFSLAMRFNINVENYDNQECYSIKYKYNEGESITYLNKQSLDLIGIKVLNNNEIKSEVKFRWKELSEGDNKNIDYFLDGYEEEIELN